MCRFPVTRSGPDPAVEQLQVGDVVFEADRLITDEQTAEAMLED
jgi:hypothetical protein